VLDVFNFGSGLLLLVELALLGVKLFAFISALTFSAPSYEAAGKLNKPTWSIILGLGVATALIFGGLLGIINLVFTIAAFVYLADVRPALKSLIRR